MPIVQGSKATIHYEQVGEAPDIVWVSGAGGTADSWGYQLPYFKDWFRNTTRMGGARRGHTHPADP